MRIIFLIMMTVVGVVMGSFLCCQARRRMRKEAGRRKLGKWSVCLKCGKKLKWYENIPVVSYILQRGKCRKCGKKIGAAEIWSEIGVGAAMLAVGFRFDYLQAGAPEWMEFFFMVMAVLAACYVAIYDGITGEMPVMVLTFATICGIMVTVAKFLGGENNLLGAVGGAAVLGGVYAVLYLVSRGKWVGSGDMWLGAVLGGLLSSAWLALLTLFFANAMATLVMYPSVRKKKERKVFFGPFMVAGFIIVYALTEYVIIMI